MPFRLQWDKDLSTGDPVIDEQHKAMFGRVEALFNALTQKRANSEVDKALKFLSDYVVEHFRDEESLMIRLRYKDYRAHKEKHEEFADQLEEFKRSFRRGEPASKLAFRLQNTLVQWLIQHITKLDRELAEVIKRP